MRKIIMLICCLLSLAVFAQTVPSESFDSFREQADSLFHQREYSQAIGLYKRLAVSGDVQACYNLNEIYSNGMGVDVDKVKAEQWLALADENEKITSLPGRSADVQSETRELTLEDLFHYSGSMIELGGRKKNQSIAVGVVGGVLGGVLAGVGVGIGSQPLYIAGGVVALGFGIASFVLNIRGNYYIREGGRILREVQVSGNGITVKF